VSTLPDGDGLATPVVAMPAMSLQGGMLLVIRFYTERQNGCTRRKVAWLWFGRVYVLSFCVGPA
jgi:hypothetical protein